LYNIESELSKAKIPVFRYDSKESTSNLISESAFYNDFETVCISKCSSEGENIGLTFGRTLSRIRHFIKTGKDPKKHFSFVPIDDKQEQIKSNERWILIDAVDSGYSIDNIIELKTIFGYMQKDALDCNVDLYIIVSANAYEVTNGENCLDVMSGKNIRFESYDEYRKFIMKTREKKEKRYKRKETT